MKDPIYKKYFGQSEEDKQKFVENPVLNEYIKKVRKKKLRLGSKMHSVRNREFAYIAMDSNTYEVIHYEESMLNISKATGIINLRSIFHDYNAGNRGPTISGFIIEKIPLVEVSKLNPEQLRKYVQEKAMGKIFVTQIKRIKNNFHAFTFDEQIEILIFFNKMEAPNRKFVNYDIIL